MKKIVSVLFIATLFLGLVSCGGGKVKLTEKGKILGAHAWKLQPQEVIDNATDALKDTTGITADIKLDGDVADFVNFIAETLFFGPSEDGKILAFSRTYGEGLLSSETLGKWEFNADETAILMADWDNAKGDYGTPVKYEIKELTADRLVLLKEGDTTPNIYKAK